MKKVFTNILMMPLLGSTIAFFGFNMMYYITIQNKYLSDTLIFERFGEWMIQNNGPARWPIGCPNFNLFDTFFWCGKYTPQCIILKKEQSYTFKNKLYIMSVCFIIYTVSFQYVDVKLIILIFSCFFYIFCFHVCILAC